MFEQIPIKLFCWSIITLSAFELIIYYTILKSLSFKNLLLILAIIIIFQAIPAFLLSFYNLKDKVLAFFLKFQILILILISLFQLVFPFLSELTNLNVFLISLYTVQLIKLGSILFIKNK